MCRWLFKMPAGFKFLEHTADVYVEAWGKTLEEAFEQSALAMFEVITDTKTVEPNDKREVTVTAEDEYLLLYEWLEELLFLYDTENLVFSEFKVEISGDEDEGYTLSGLAKGEVFNREKHEPRTEVKAITLNMMEIIKSKDLVKVRFVLDI